MQCETHSELLKKNQNLIVIDVVKNRFYLGTIANVGKKSQNKSGLIPNTTKTSEDL